ERRLSLPPAHAAPPAYNPVPSLMDQSFDAVIIGSGFGGALSAHALVEAGWSVLLLERGDWVERGPAASRAENFAVVSPRYCRETGYSVEQDGRAGPQELGALFC